MLTDGRRRRWYTNSSPRSLRFRWAKNHTSFWKQSAGQFWLNKTFSLCMIFWAKWIFFLINASGWYILQPVLKIFSWPFNLKKDKLFIIFHLKEVIQKTNNISVCYMTPIKYLLWLAETSLHWLWQILMSNSDCLCQCWQRAKNRLN